MEQLKSWARALVFLVVALTVVGCASSTQQVDSLLNSAVQIPRTYEIQGVPFVNQQVGHCGPATLTMAMLASGAEVDLSTVTSQVYTPDVKGSFQSDLIGASRRHGMLAIPISNLKSLLREVAAGNPVIVFENLALSWLPRWHYALVYGYDLNREVVIMHSGPEKAKHWDLRKFERSWKLAEYWGLVVLPPGRLSATADELDHMTAASMLEKQGLSEKAFKSYSAILQRWPISLGALVGNGNYYYSKRDYAASAKDLSRAVAAHPRSAIAWHNLAISQKMLKQLKKAKQSAREAIGLVDGELKVQYQSSLRELL